MFGRHLRLPLERFPFTPVHASGRPSGAERFFNRNARLKALVGAATDPQRLAGYLLPNAWVLRDSAARRSVLAVGPLAGPRDILGATLKALYFVFANCLPACKALLLHGVGTERQGRGLLFLGLSGQGKSTIAHLAGQGQVIADDGIVLQKNGTGFYLGPTPFDQQPRPSAWTGSARLSGKKLAMGLFLEKSAVVNLQPVNPAEACCRILQNHIHFFRFVCTDTARQAFALTADLCRTIPFYRLYFRKAPDFWHLIEEHLPSNPITEEQSHGHDRQQAATL